MLLVKTKNAQAMKYNSLHLVTNTARFLISFRIKDLRRHLLTYHLIQTPQNLPFYTVSCSSRSSIYDPRLLKSSVINNQISGWL